MERWAGTRAGLERLVQLMKLPPRLRSLHDPCRLRRAVELSQQIADRFSFGASRRIGGRIARVQSSRRRWRRQNVVRLRLVAFDISTN